MAVLEVGINLSNNSLIEIKYYSSSDDHGLDPNLRAGFLAALESFTSEVFGDALNVVSLASFKLVCACDSIGLPGNTEKTALLSWAIIEKDTDVVVVRKLLGEINAHFLNRFALNDIFEKKPKFFAKFESRMNEILGDLKLKTEDRFKSLF